MSQARKMASFLSSTGAAGWMSRSTTGRTSCRTSLTKTSGWWFMSAPITSQHAVLKAGSSSSSSSSPPPSSSSPGWGALAAAFWAAPRSKEAEKTLRTTSQMCFSCSAVRMFWPAFFKQAATPSARVLSALVSTTSPSVVSSLGRMRPRNSCTSCPRTCAWPPSRAARHSSPQVSKARSRIVSAMEKSKTGRSACAVWATKGAYILPNSSTKV
mmetsp:Transcript_51468/g.153875  ORF Transcript_51468/g.153875 Transcript_51468/m.153875 type:complete len:213 (+) Transcript_51468:290-928(+)